MELQHRPVLLYLHTRWTCLSGLGHVSISIHFTINGEGTLIGKIRFVVGIGQLLVMASLAEYCSLWPTAGGQQFYTQVVAPEKYRRFLSYLVGWCVLVGEISTSTSCALNSADIVAAIVQITRPEIVWQVNRYSLFRQERRLTLEI